MLRRHEGQRRAWNSRQRYVFVIAGSQGGKTSFGPWWLAREIQRCGPGDYLAVSSTVDLARMKMLPALRETFEWVLRAGEWSSSERTIRLYDPKTGRMMANGEPWGRIILRSAAADGGLESATGNAAWLDECGQDEFTIETWEAVLRRLSLATERGGGRVLGTTTPYNLGWLKSEVYDRWVRGEPGYDVIQFASTTNPAFPQAEFERRRATMPPWRFEMFYRGNFGRPAGLVYDCFEPEPGSGHVVEPFDIPAGWPRYVGVDFGAVNTSTVWLAHDVERDRYYVYRESLRGNISTREHVAAVVQDGQGENVSGFWGGAGSEEQQRMDWAVEGQAVMRPPVADVESGIAKVYGLLRQKRLYVFAGNIRAGTGCPGLLDEFGSYRRKVTPTGETLEDIEDKRKFHRLDALRYVVLGATGGVPTVGGYVW